VKVPGRLAPRSAKNAEGPPTGSSDSIGIWNSRGGSTRNEDVEVVEDRTTGRCELADKLDAGDGKSQSRFGIAAQTGPLRWRTTPDSTRVSPYRCNQTLLGRYNGLRLTCRPPCVDHTPTAARCDS